MNIKKYALVAALSMLIGGTELATFNQIEAKKPKKTANKTNKEKKPKTKKPQKSKNKEKK